MQDMMTRDKIYLIFAMYVSLGVGMRNNEK